MKRIQLDTNNAQKRSGAIHRKFVKEQISIREEGRIHTPALYEETLIQAVKRGDFEAVLQAIQSPVSGEMGTLSSDPDRNARYLFVVAVTIATRAAMEEGVNVETAYQLSDSYCRQMDSASDVKEIEPIAINMLRDVCGCVRTAHGQKTYSAVVSECCSYIVSNLHNKMSLAELSEHCGMSERRLSAKFRKETGISPIEYAHNLKLEEACRLLQYSTYTISEISSLLGYGSQSYFTELFRRKYNCTPKEYRG